MSYRDTKRARHGAGIDNFRFSTDREGIIEAYNQTTPKSPLSKNTPVIMKDPVWVVTLNDGSILSCGPTSKSMPEGFNRMSIYFSKPNQNIKKRPNNDAIIPTEAKHHRYHHYVDMYLTDKHQKRNLGHGEGGQKLLESIYNFYQIVDYDVVKEALKAAKDMVMKDKNAVFRSVVKNMHLYPDVQTKPLYVFM
jgi:hypothetical protein